MFGLLLIVGMLVGIWVAGWIFVEIMKALQSWKAERIHDKKMKTDPAYKKNWEWDHSEEGMRENAKWRAIVYDLNREHWSED